MVDGIEVHWIVMSPHVKETVEHVWNKQTFHVLPTMTQGRASSLYRADRKAIEECLLRLQPQVVHGWGTEDVYGLAAAQSPFPNIVSMQGILSHYILKNRMSPRFYLQALIELYVLRKALCLTTESEWGRRVVRQRSPRKRIEIVEYGVQNHFLEMPWQPDPHKPAAIFIGSLGPRKGIQDAVEAFRSSKLASAELWVVGNGGQWAAELQAKAPSNVKWMGRLSPEETAQFLSKAWCLVLPTRADTSPNVVKEARVIGLPVISTPCGGQIAYIQQGENGFVVEPGDTARLAEALQGLLSDFDRCRAMGHHRHEEHRYLLHPQRTAEGFLRLYKELSGQ